MTITKERVTLGELKRRGASIISGDKYIPSSWFPKKVISLAEVRRRLSKIKGDLSQTISEMRDEE